MFVIVYSLNSVHRFDHFICSVGGYQLGDIVAACNFDESDGTDPGCEHFSVSAEDHRLYFQSTYEYSRHTGPSEDHTSGTGTRINKNDKHT